MVKKNSFIRKLLLLYEIELEIDRDAHTYVSAKELLSITNAVKNINKRDLIQQNLSGDSFAKKLKIKKIALANDILTPQSKSHAI